MLGLQAMCKSKVPDVIMAYVDPHSSHVIPGNSSVLTVPGCHAIGPLSVGFLEWQLVTLEKVSYCHSRTLDQKGSTRGGLVRGRAGGYRREARSKVIPGSPLGHLWVPDFWSTSVGPRRKKGHGGSR
jgi:hypothetical protein